MKKKKMEKEFDKFNKIDISQFKIIIKLEEGSFWTIYKVENKNDSSIIYAAKTIKKEYKTDYHNLKEYQSHVKNELNTMTQISSPFEFKGLSLTDFNGNNNITIFLDFKKYNKFVKLRESFSNYTKMDINQYEIKTTLKKTDFLTVYQVFNKNNFNEIYEAKNIKNNYGENEKEMYQYIYSIKRLIKTMINCKNPTLLKFKGLSLTNFSGANGITIFTNFVSKESLSKVCFEISNPPQNYDNTARQIILVGISYGMMVLHKNIMTHNDLNPDNILLDKNLQPVINNFGLFNNINFKSSVNCDSYYYMAPEILSTFFADDNPNFDRAIDVYAFGILMYEIVTKNHAFESNVSLSDLYERVVVEKERPQFNNQVKGSIQKLIDKCWAPDKKDRISFEQIFDMLSFNIEENKSQNSYNKYYLDGVDVDKLFNYIYSIIDHNIDLDKLLEKIKENLNDNKNVLENNKSLSKNVVKIINDVMRNKEKLIQKIEKMKLQQSSSIHLKDKLKSKSSPGSPNNQQINNESEIEFQRNLTANTRMNQENQIISKVEKQRTSKIIRRQSSYNMNESNSKFLRTKTSLNQNNKNQTKQNQQKKTPLSTLSQKQKQEQPQVKSNHDIVYKPKSNQKKPRARTPTFLMHKLNQQLREPLNSSKQTMIQKQTIKSQSQDKQLAKAIDHKTNRQTQNSSNKAPSVNSKQSKRSITPDNLTYMLKKKREIQLDNSLKNKSNRQKNEFNQNQRQHKEQPYVKQTSNNNTQQKNKEQLKKQNVLIMSQTKKSSRSKTPDNLMQKPNNQRKYPLNNEKQKQEQPKSSRTKIREYFSADYIKQNKDSLNLNQQNLLNRNLKREELEFWLNKSKQSSLADNNVQQNQQSKKQGNRSKQSKKSKFKI